MARIKPSKRRMGGDPEKEEEHEDEPETEEEDEEGSLINNKKISECGRAKSRARARAQPRGRGKQRQKSHNHGAKSKSKALAKALAKAKGQTQAKTKVVLKARETRHKAYNQVYHSDYANAMQEGTPMRGPSPVPMFSPNSIVQLRACSVGDELGQVVRVC